MVWLLREMAITRGMPRPLSQPRRSMNERSFSCQRSKGRARRQVAGLSGCRVDPATQQPSNHSRYTCHLSCLCLSEEYMMKPSATAEPADLVLQTELDAVMNDRGVLTSPRPSVDRDKLQHHLREALRLLHVDLENEN